MARKKEKIHGSKRKDQSKVKRKDLSFWLLLKLNFSYPCSTAIQEADDHPSHVFQKKEKILLEKTMPSLRTLSTQGQAQQGQRTFRQEIIPSVTRPVSWSTAHNWQEDNYQEDRDPKKLRSYCPGREENPLLASKDSHWLYNPGQSPDRIGERRWETYPLMAQQRQRHIV
eukprot:XP_022259005.1 uncharacterized protein LOC111090036 isoform X5 [Canis lupus familiaris]